MKNQQLIDRLTAIANRATTDIFITLDGDTESWNIRTADDLYHYRNREFSEPVDRDNLLESVTQIVGILYKFIDPMVDPD
jgi:hypothetical protein